MVIAVAVVVGGGISSKASAFCLSATSLSLLELFFFLTSFFAFSIGYFVRKNNK